VIPLHRPAIQRKDLEAVLESLVNDQLGFGSLSHKFSQIFEKHLFGDSARVFRDRLTAAHFLWEVWGLQPGDGIVMAPFGSALLAYSAIQRGLSVYFADVLANLPVLDPQSVASIVRANPSIKVIIADHPYGLIPDVKTLQKLGLKVLEDVRWGYGGVADMELVGSRGQAALISLEDDGILCAGGGEVLVVRGKDSAQELKKVLQRVTDQVFLSDLNAALGLAQYEQKNIQIAKRREFLERWVHAFRRDSGHLFLQSTEYAPVMSHLVFQVPINASEVIAYARKKGVKMALAFQDSASSFQPQALEHLPHASALLGRSLLYPLYPALSANEQKTLLSVLSSLP